MGLFVFYFLTSFSVSFSFFFFLFPLDLGRIKMDAKESFKKIKYLAKAIWPLKMHLGNPHMESGKDNLV